MPFAENPQYLLRELLDFAENRSFNSTATEQKVEAALGTIGTGIGADSRKPIFPGKLPVCAKNLPLPAVSLCYDIVPPHIQSEGTNCGSLS